jgi:hypothetical protein
MKTTIERKRQREVDHIVPLYGSRTSSRTVLMLFKKKLFAERWVCHHHHVDFLRIFVNASCRWSCLWATCRRPKHHDLSITDFSQCPRHGFWHPRSITRRDSFVLVFNLPCSYHSPPFVTLLLFLFVVVWLFTLIRVSSPVTHSFSPFTPSTVRRKEMRHGQKRGRVEKAKWTHKSNLYGSCLLPTWGLRGCSAPICFPW